MRLSECIAAIASERKRLADKLQHIAQHNEGHRQKPWKDRFSADEAQRTVRQADTPH
jgi:hypothetical protein